MSTREERAAKAAATWRPARVPLITIVEMAKLKKKSGSKLEQPRSKPEARAAAKGLRRPGHHRARDRHAARLSP
jgi:hypothetical protein